MEPQLSTPTHVQTHEMSKAEAKKKIRDEVRCWLKKDFIVGFGVEDDPKIGFKIVFRTNKQDIQLPSTLEIKSIQQNVPIEACYVGNIVPWILNRRGQEPDATRVRPVKGGKLICTEDNTCGTLGGAFSYKNGYYAFTCAHVADGKTVYQPYTNQFDKSKLGVPVSPCKYSIFSTRDEASDNLFQYDIAYFQSTKNVCCNQQIEKIGAFKGEIREPVPGEIVWFFGGMSGQETAKIISIDDEFIRTEKTGFSGWKDALLLEGYGEPGDSGSLLIAASDKRIVGMITGGPEHFVTQNKFYACRVPQ